MFCAEHVSLTCRVNKFQLGRKSKAKLMLPPDSTARSIISLFVITIKSDLMSFSLALATMEKLNLEFICFATVLLMLSCLLLYL